MRNADSTQTATARTTQPSRAARASRRKESITHAAASVLSCYAAGESSTHAILAAIKPHDASNAALAMAQWLAEHERRELHVVSVIDTAPPISSVAAGAPFVPPFHDERERRTVERALRAAFQRHGRTAARYRIAVLEGSAAPTVAAIARDHEVRMVVVGRGSHGLLRHLLYGEQVMEIIRESQSPVLVVPPDATTPIDRAMVAFDFSMASVRAATTAHEMLGAGGRLTLVHVANPGVLTGTRSRWALRSAGRRTRETLEEFARVLPPRRGVIVETERLHGDPVEALTAYAASQSMQLLACGWHEHALLDRLFGESDATELLHRAQCAVLIAPEPRGREFDDAC
jgi:nucleotide-binding universal stress UspA family protein